MKQGKHGLQDCKKNSPHFAYPYIGKESRADQIESKKQSQINDHISFWGNNQTQVYSSVK